MVRIAFFIEVSSTIPFISCETFSVDPEDGLVIFKAPLALFPVAVFFIPPCP